MNDLRSNRRRCALSLLVCVVWPSAGSAAADEPVRWRTGTELGRQRGERIGITWSGMPLRRGLANLARSQRIAVLLDRRIDPERTLELALEGETVDEVFERIARDQNLGLSWFGSLAYFAPPAAARRLRTLTTLRENEARPLPSKTRQALLRRRAWQWDELATPREVLEKWVGEAGLRLEGLAQVPHDLWAAADGPPMTLVERLSLVLGEFDLTFQFAADGRALTLVSVPDEVAIEKSYPGGKNPRELAERWALLAPDCHVEVAGGQVVVRGLVEDHEKLAGQKTIATSTAAKTTTLYTLTVSEKPLGSVLEQLAETLKLDLRIDREALARASISLDQFVSFKVEKATFDELLTASLKSSGLSFRREGRTLKVFPAGKYTSRGRE
ncbi:MAG TPA: STN domain-containing protein [Pirellulales bacterium]|nr:STN domain-containing protein [Pirellulales bacterium]